jgi:periplasmic protein TonB
MFESSLIDLETKNQPRGRRWLSLPIAVALHLVGIAAFAFASYWTVGAVQEPSLNVVFLSLTPPPAPGGGGGGRPSKPIKPIEKAEAPVKAAQPVQPTTETMPDDVPTPATTPTVEDAVSDLASGDDSTGADLPVGPGYGPGPVGPGVGPGPGGDGDGDGPGIGGADDQPLRFTVGMTRPEVVHQVQPRYTEVARRAGVQGSVIVEAIIDEQGNVDNVRVLRGLPMGLDKAAIEAIQQWRFKPATMGSKPVKVYFTLTVNFTIQR